MTPRVNMVCLRKDATIDNLKDLIIKDKYSRIPVYKDRLDNMEGIVMAKDILEYSDDKHKAQPIEALIRPVVFVPESMPVRPTSSGSSRRPSRRWPSSSTSTAASRAW